MSRGISNKEIKLKFYGYSQSNAFKKVSKESQRIITLRTLLNEAKEVQKLGIAHSTIIVRDKLIITYYDQVANYIYSSMYKIMKRED